MCRLRGGWARCNCRAAFEKLRDSAIAAQLRKWWRSKISRGPDEADSTDPGPGRRHKRSPASVYCVVPLDPAVQSSVRKPHGYAAADAGQRRGGTRRAEANQRTGGLRELVLPN